MYDWLSDIPADRNVQVVTPNRRLARHLREAHAAAQLAAGRAAWRSPEIFALTDWYSVLAAGLSSGYPAPARLNEQQARLLWEECLRQEMDEGVVHLSLLARLCRDAWQRLRDWRVPLDRVRASAGTPDQHLFARSAMRYAALLDERRYLDGATQPYHLLRALDDSALLRPAGVWCVGFDRQAPQFRMLLDALERAGTERRDVETRVPSELRLLAFPNRDAELRAAGAWARGEIERDPAQSLAIVVTRLEQDAGRSADLIREGLVPGWQAASAQVAAAVNLSYGSRLGELPSVHVALLALRWLFQPLTGADIGMLLRTPFLGRADPAGRSRLDVRLRAMPDREWRLPGFVEAMSGRVDAADADDWFARLRRVAGALAGTSAIQGPSRWAACFESSLAQLNWPGDAPLSSEDFQLDNRWRKLLNEFARLELVIPRISGREAVARLAGLAADTLFQPESPGAVVTVLGPLEAAGLEFDALWLTGASAAEWPPGARPSALLARDLQREYRMPDATPEDGAEFSRRVLRRIVRSAPQCTLSYPAMIGDAAQLPTRLVQGIEPEPGGHDPGWFATRYAGAGDFEMPAERVPAVRPGERVGGGAGVIGLQAEDPFAAFVRGRLNARQLEPYTRGIAPNVRGSLIHTALARLYTGVPDSSALRAWTGEERRMRITDAVTRAYGRDAHFGDDVLRALLQIEKSRTVALLEKVIELDVQRRPFAIASIETSTDATLGRVQLSLRCDRIDRMPDGSLVILDYKSGDPDKFISRDGPNDLQLIVYSCIAGAPVGGLGLFVVDRKRVEIDGAGPVFGASEGWPAFLAEWQRTVMRLANEMAAGDVRLNSRQGLTKARGLSVLSRYPEVDRGD